LIRFLESWFSGQRGEGALHEVVARIKAVVSLGWASCRLCSRGLLP